MSVAESDRSNFVAHAAEAISAGRLIVLAGAGVSADEPLSLPSWPALVRRLAEHARQYLPRRADAILEELDGGDLLAAADLYTAGDRVPPAARADLFRTIFDTSLKDVTNLATFLAALDVRIWLTTNYDNNLRGALSTRDGESVETYYNQQEDLEAALSLWQMKRMLIHLHGRASVYKSVIYDSNGYRRMEDLAPYRELLRRSLLQHSILAIGFGCTDPPFVELLRFVKREMSGAAQHTHFAILPASSPADLDLLRACNFEVLRYDDRAGHQVVAEVVHELGKRRVSARSRMISLSSSTPTAGAFKDLVSAFLSITNPERGSTYDTAAGAIVLGADHAASRFSLAIVMGSGLG